jgi:hypothetical protein
MRNNITVIFFVLSVLLDTAVLVSSMVYLIYRPTLVMIDAVFIVMIFCMLLNLANLYFLSTWKPE